MEKRVKILVSEDAQDFVQKYSKDFAEKGMELLPSAKDGLKLLEKIEELHPEVVLADLFMPGLDGIGVMRACASRGGKQPLFVILSGFTSPRLEREVLSSGAAYFVVSPFDGRELAHRISHLVNEKRDMPGEVSSPDDLEVQITEILHQIGVPAHIKGYHYLRDSILMAVRTPEIINAVTKRLYPGVAKEYETTPSRVERAIRHAIEVAWDRGDVDVLNSYFGYTIHNTRGKPTNSEFIAMISDRLRLHMKSVG